MENEKPDYAQQSIDQLRQLVDVKMTVGPPPVAFSVWSGGAIAIVSLLVALVPLVLELNIGVFFAGVGVGGGVTWFMGRAVRTW